MRSENDYECLKLNEIEKNPFCKHGPTIIFKSCKKTFYACSACRDRKECNFYSEYNENKPFPKEKLDFWLKIYKDFQADYFNAFKIREKVLKLEESKRCYCQTCFRFVLGEENKHIGHKLIRDVSDRIMKRPISEILEPLVSNSSNAQYIFDNKSADFILGHISKFSYDSVLCIGCPSIFELLNDNNSSVNRLLLDIDDRFAQFYDEKQFIKYNMFNNHFFSHRQNYEGFLKRAKNLFVIVDPPYGGIVQLIANTIESIRRDFKGDKISIFLIYPYFIQKWIEKWLPDFQMLDYKLSYQNQRKFSTEKNVKKGSPARIFTNVAPINRIELPLSEGYKYCKTCEKFTFDENFHCPECDICPSIDGGSYKHCEQCNRCVKASYEHCKRCKQCHIGNNCHKRSNDEETDELLLKKQRKISNQ